MKQACGHQVKLRPPQAGDTTTLRVWQPTAAPRDIAVLLAHGAGSALDERVLVTVAGGLADRGVTSATFNFAYREAGRRPPDRADRLQRAFVDVLTALTAVTGIARTVLGGRSMGGRIATMLLADGHGAGGVAMGYPLWPGGRRPADARRTAHWPRITAPVLFVHGDRDRLCPVDALDLARHEHLRDTAHCAHVVTGADHGFAVRVRDDRSTAEVDAELIDTIDAWLRAAVEENRHG
ncbi:alpha/beta fold hydrolase [soil metagenome]